MKWPRDINLTAACQQSREATRESSSFPLVSNLRHVQRSFGVFLAMDTDKPVETRRCCLLHGSIRGLLFSQLSGTDRSLVTGENETQAPNRPAKIWEIRKISQAFQVSEHYLITQILSQEGDLTRLLPRDASSHGVRTCRRYACYEPYSPLRSSIYQIRALFSYLNSTSKNTSYISNEIWIFSCDQGRSTTLWCLSWQSLIIVGYLLSSRSLFMCRWWAIIYMTMLLAQSSADLLHHIFCLRYKKILIWTERPIPGTSTRPM